MASQGKRPSGGLIKAVYNIERFEKRIKNTEEQLENGYYQKGSLARSYALKKLKDDKKIISELIKIRDKVESTEIIEQAQSLIDNVAVN